MLFRFIKGETLSNTKLVIPACRFTLATRVTCAWFKNTVTFVMVLGVRCSFSAAVNRKDAKAQRINKRRGAESATVFINLQSQITNLKYLKRYVSMFFTW